MMLDQRQRVKPADWGLSVNTADAVEDHADHAVPRERPSPPVW
jgi:hypothetical protein